MKENRFEENGNFLTQEEIDALKEEFGVEEKDNNLILRVGEKTHYFPKERRYPKQGGGWVDLREDITRKLGEGE